jgi:hypothetical protein
MFNVSDLNEKYQYDYSLCKRLGEASSNNGFDRKDPFRVVGFIYEVVIANKWKWDDTTHYNCKRIEFLIQEKVPFNLSNNKEIYLWIVNNWNNHDFFTWEDVSLN